MAMLFPIYDDLAGAPLSEFALGGDTVEESSAKKNRNSNSRVHILWEKLHAPAIKGLMERERITELLTRSIAGFPVTLISGRAGTGKTFAAAAFAAGRKDVAWYTLDPPDRDWNIFAGHFAACLAGRGMYPGLPKYVTTADKMPERDRVKAMENFISFAFEKASHGGHSGHGAGKKTGRITETEAKLIVLDDIHHIFDADWFVDLFNLLIRSLPFSARLLLVCRSRPPGPMWRLRSKQAINVIDEKMLAFNLAETEKLFGMRGLSLEAAREAQEANFGRIALLLRYAEDLAGTSNQGY